MIATTFGYVQTIPRGQTRSTSSYADLHGTERTRIRLYASEVRPLRQRSGHELLTTRGESFTHHTARHEGRPANVKSAAICAALINAAPAIAAELLQILTSALLSSTTSRVCRPTSLRLGCSNSMIRLPWNALGKRYLSFPGSYFVARTGRALSVWEATEPTRCRRARRALLQIIASAPHGGAHNAMAKKPRPRQAPSARQSVGRANLPQHNWGPRSAITRSRTDDHYGMTMRRSSGTTRHERKAIQSSR